MTGRSRFRFRFRGVMSLVKSIASQFFDILQKEEASSNTNVFYDPADLTSLRVNIDGSGGNPAVGDPVGMMLDTSQFGGKTAEDYLASQPELVTNGTFDSDVSGWTIPIGVGTFVSASQVGVLSRDAAASGYTSAVFSIPTQIGKVYTASGSLVSTDGTDAVIAKSDLTSNINSNRVDIYGGLGGTNVLGEGSAIFIATSTTTHIHLFLVDTGSGSVTCSFDNISVKEIPGHHAIAPSDSARPVLFDDPDLTAAALTDNGQRGEAINSVTSYSSSGGTENGLPFEQGSDYEVTFTVESRTVGTMKPQFTGGVAQIGTPVSANGTYTETLTATNNANFQMVAGGGFDGTVSNISVKKVLTAFDERGAELVTNGGFDDAGDLAEWGHSNTSGTSTFTVSDGEATFTRDTFGDAFYQTDVAPAVAGVYLLSFDITALSGGNLRYSFSPNSARNTANEKTVTTTGSYSTAFVSDGTLLDFVFDLSANGASVTIDNISVKEVLYPNLVTNGTFDTDSDWTKAAGVTISGGTLNFSSVTSGSAAYVSGITTQYKWYRVRCYCSSYTSGGFRLVCNGASVLPDYQTATGWFEAIMFVDSTNTNIGIQADSSFTGSIDNVIVQELPASIDRKYYLDTDGSDDWMQVTPTLNLGEQWWHTGAWISDSSAGKRPFATSNNFQGAPRDISGNWVWYDPSSVAQIICTSNPSASKHVLTIEQADTNSLVARFNGVQEADPITPYDDSAVTQGVALFSQQNNLYANGWNGRFYGGSWGQGQVDYDELTVLQDYLGTTTQPPIDPPDVTEYADVYELLAAQTGAVLFDIDDTTSLRVGRDGSGGVPVDGDPVGMMLDVSDTGGQTMAAKLASQPELVTNGTFDSDISGWTGSGWSFNSGAAQSSGASVALSQSLSLTDGAYYLVSFLNVSGTDPLEIRFDGSPRVTSGVINPSVGVTYSFVLQANSTSDSIQIARTGATLGNSVDNISVKKISSHAAIAPSDSARPTLASVLDTTASELTDDGTRGPELVTNGTFDSDTAGWTASGATLSSESGRIRVANDGANYGYAYQAIACEIGAVYQLQLNIYPTTANATVRLGSNAAASSNRVYNNTNVSSDETVNTTFQALTSTVYVRVGNESNTDGQYAEFDNISVRKVNTVFDGQPNLVTNGTFDTDSDWIKGAGWSIGSGVASRTGAGNSNLYTTNAISIVENRWYFVQFYVSAYTSGQVRPIVGAGGVGASVSSTGWHSEYIRCSGSPYLFMQGLSFEGSIDNVSVQEVPASVARAFYLDFDGSDDNLILDADTIAASSNATLYKTFRGDTTDTQQIMFAPDVGPYILAAQTGPATNLSSNVGSPVYREDGSIATYTDRPALFAALIDNTDHTIGVEEADLSAASDWTTEGFYIGGERDATYNSKGRLYAWAAVDTRLDGRGRDLLENFMIGKKTS